MPHLTLILERTVPNTNVRVVKVERSVRKRRLGGKRNAPGMN
jgi:hypothetical protein